MWPEILSQTEYVYLYWFELVPWVSDGWSLSLLFTFLDKQMERQTYWQSNYYRALPFSNILFLCFGIQPGNNFDTNDQLTGFHHCFLPPELLSPREIILFSREDGGGGVTMPWKQSHRNQRDTTQSMEFLSTKKSKNIIIFAFQ